LHYDGIFAGSSSSDQVRSRGDDLRIHRRLTVAHDNSASIGVFLISWVDPTHTISLSKAGDRAAIGKVLAYLE